MTSYFSQILHFVLNSCSFRINNPFKRVFLSCRTQETLIPSSKSTFNILASVTAVPSSKKVVMFKIITYITSLKYFFLNNF